jgi:hypothetical protein
MEWIIQGLQRLSEIKPDALQKATGHIMDQRPSFAIIPYTDGKISL